MNKTNSNVLKGVAVPQTEGLLKRNIDGRWEIGDMEFQSGDPMELLIDGHWVRGFVEFWDQDYHWYSSRDYVLVILRSGQMARTSGGRF